MLPPKQEPSPVMLPPNSLLQPSKPLPLTPLSPLIDRSILPQLHLVSSRGAGSRVPGCLLRLILCRGHITAVFTLFPSPPNIYMHRKYEVPGRNSVFFSPELVLGSKRFHFLSGTSKLTLIFHLSFDQLS